MENNNELNKFLSNKMSIDNLEFEAPDISKMEEARQKILLRKKPVKEEKELFLWLANMIKPRLKFYQLGVSVLLTGICLIYSLEIDENTKNNNGFEGYTTDMVASKSPTISVNSSTLLTSIPTLIIRN